MVILDTDHMSLLQWKQSEPAKRILARLEQTPPEAAWTTVISHEEQVRGWIGAIGKAKRVKDQVECYRRLGLMLKLYCSFAILEFSEQSAIEHARLRKQYPRLASMDLKIAAIAIIHNATILTRNIRHFGAIRPLKVEDWSC